MSKVSVAFVSCPRQEGMGVLKKAPLLGSSASLVECGPSAIDEDRTLLSHYGGRGKQQHELMSIATRKAAAIRRNIVAKGLARQYGEQKAREEHYKMQVPRYQKQQKILENYRRHQAHHHETTEQRSETNESTDNEEEFSENVVLVVPKRTTSAPTKPPPRYPGASPVVPPRNATSFSRYASLRRLHDNQNLRPSDETGVISDQDSVGSSLHFSPSETSIPKSLLRPIPRPSSCTNLPTTTRSGAKEDVPKTPSNPSAPGPWLSETNRSSKLVLCELGVTKDVMLREQLIHQMRQALPMVDQLARDVLKCHSEHKAAQEALNVAKALPSFRIRKTNSLIGLSLPSAQRPDADQAHQAVAEAETAVSESKAELNDLTDKLRYHLHNVGMLTNGIQQATLSIVDGILEWRGMRQRRRKMSNFQRLYRFPWKRRKISNYLLHIGGDLGAFFPSIALELLLGPEATFNPLLLPRSTLQEVEKRLTGKTFLTEGVDGSSATRAFNAVFDISSPKLHERDKKLGVGAAQLSVLRESLAAVDDTACSANAVTRPESPPVELDRLQRCFEALHHESELEAQERQVTGAEERRLNDSYDPFSLIKSAGGVEETLSNMMDLQSPTSQRLGEQLRLRQEDTTRIGSVAPTSTNSPSAANPLTEVLCVNPDRLRRFLQQRAAILEPVASCELRDIQRWGQTNKLQGKIMVRTNNEKRVEHYLARKIQLQYLAYRQRNAMRTNLSRFVRNVRVSVINIQRVFRGHRAKTGYDGMKKVLLERNRQVAAVRTIVNSFRRFRRRQRHRRSMTVESIAQAQLINILTSKLNESADAQEAAERYRRVGEERRRQRIVLLQKHKMEQQELERRRNAAAVRMQAVVRSHLAQGQVKVLRQEKKAHMSAVSAMAIQSTIRKFLDTQQARRQRFRKDLERVNQSAVRIQSIYRGYNSRASLLGQLDEKTCQALGRVPILSEEDEDVDEEVSSSDEEEQHTAETVSEKASSMERLPPIGPGNSRPSSGKSIALGQDDSYAQRSRIPTSQVSLPPIWNRDGSSSSLLSSTGSSSGTGRRISLGMTRIELKLKEAEIDDRFDTPPSRRNSFVGHMRHQA